MFSRRASHMVFAQGMDFTTFAIFYLLAGSSLLLAEQNPIVLAIMGVGGVLGVGLAKIGATVVCAYLYSHRRRSRVWSARVATGLVFAVTLSGIIGSGFNLASLVYAMHLA